MVFQVLLALYAGFTAPSPGNIAGTVSDSSTGQPLPSTQVTVLQVGRIVATATTDAFGRYLVHNLPPGRYDVRVRFPGFHPKLVTTTVGSGATAEVDFPLSPAAVQLSTVEVVGSAEPLAVDTRTGNQVFQQNEYHGAPVITTSQVLQQAIVGAVRAPTGEVHIRGQHAEYTYYVDGVPVPSGISGSLNELFDPSVVNQIEFQTGGWDAAYGGKNAAVVDVTTRIPAGGFHLDLAGYGGSFGSNGQSVAASTNAGPWGFFASGARQGTDMRQEPVVADTATGEPVNFHNQGTDWFSFGKVEYRPSSSDVVNLALNWSTTHFEVPYDSSGGVALDAHQEDINGFANLSWRHQFGEASGGEAPSELFAGTFFRHGSLQFTPGPTDPPTFVFYPDTTPYDLSEDRSFDTQGLKVDYTWRLSHEVSLVAGTLDSWTTGHEDFVTTDSLGNHGPASNSALSGHDFGIYTQTALAPVEAWELRLGVRYDAHTAPFAGTQDQVSPRVKLSFFPSPATTVFAYYGRQFIPTNVEDLRAITSVADSGVVAQPTLPERDDFYEVGVAQRIGSVAAKVSAYQKRSSPGIDDNTVPGSTIVTSVNIDKVTVTGIELAVEVRPAGPLSGYVNFALNHAYGHGPITGGFFPAQLPPGDFDLDHDQRISAVAEANYAPGRLFLNLSATYGTGLTNGADPSSCGCTYGTGLLDFNAGTHVNPSLILNTSVGYTIPVGRSALRPQIYVQNLLDHHYLLKGAFFSGPAVGRPRTVQVRINLAW